LIEGTLDSAYGAPAGWAVSYPPDSVPGDPLPVVVSLHGRGGDHRSTFDDLGMGRVLAAQVRDGGPRVAVAAIDGGDTYWHRRSTGEDSGAMVAEEFLPLLAGRGLDTTRVGLIGWSMGGFGALLLAGSGVVAARGVATMSAALWQSRADVSAGSFDDADDFARNDVFALRDGLATIPLRMDCGDLDPFLDANEAFRAGVRPEPAGGVEPGGHDVDYWRRVVPAQLGFVARAVTRR